MEKTMNNDMETGGIEGLKELVSSYHIVETQLCTMYTRCGNFS